MIGGIERGRRLASAVTSGAGLRALRHGVLPSQVHQSVLRRARPDIVIDAGANRGQFTLDVLRAVPDAEVWAFEPLLTEADVFDAAIGDRSSVRLDRRGLWSTTGRMVMNTSTALDSSSLLPIGDLQVVTFPGTAASGQVWVDVVRLDEAFTPEHDDLSCLLKIDVQGGELEVLVGAGDLLRDISWVYVELSLVEFYVGQPLAAEVVDFLGDRHFELVDFGPVTRRHGRAVQFDALFERR